MSAVVFCVVGAQFWLYSKTGEIRRDEACLDYAGSDVILYPCHGAKGNQFWEYDPEVNQTFLFYWWLHSRIVHVSLFFRRILSSTEAAKIVWQSARTRKKSRWKNARKTILEPNGNSRNLKHRRSYKISSDSWSLSLRPAQMGKLNTCFAQQLKTLRWCYIETSTWSQKSM